LQAALNRKARAKQFFTTLNSVNRYAILYRIHDAKKPETRADRIKKFVEMLTRGETLHPQNAGKTAAKKTAAKKIPAKK